MINVHGLRRNVKNVVKNYSEAQVKVREATSNDPWGPSGTLMGEIADLTYNVVAFSEIMQVIWKRLNDHGKNWKHVYKALVLLDYLIKTGSEKVTQQCKENIFAIQTLKDFQYFEESKDQGVNVREKAKQLVALLKDDERLKNERARAIKARERFALSASLARPDPLPRQIGSADYNQASFDEENAVSLTALSLSELEQARPQTMGEEELQLQLALAMSREEADQAEKQRRNDDLRLQMALSESQEEFKRKVPEPNASAIDDLLGINLPLATSTSPVPLLDPWGMPIVSVYSSKDTNVMDDWDTPNSITESNHETMRNDPWSPCSENLIDNGDLNAEFLASSEENKNTPYGMRKSMSADISHEDGPKSLDDFLNSKSNLIHIDGTRPRNIGNPFQAAKPPPPTINEMRGQNGTSPRPPNSDFLPSSTSMPFFPQNNPFL